LIRRGALLVIALGVTACANDYDQFDFSLGPRGAGGTSSETPRDSSPADEASDSTPDAVHDGGPPSDDAVVDVMADADASEGAIDAPDAGDAMADALPEADAGADVPAPDAGGEDAGPDADAGTPEDANPDVSIDDGGADVSIDDSATDADADVSVGPDAPSDGASDDGDAGCGPGQKRCRGMCVPDDDPATGCANPSCDPCILAHATARCASDGKCAIGVCAAGFDDCNHASDDGCEASLWNDVLHCGACGRTCSDLHVLSRECAGGLCVSACEPGFGNCNRPASGADDGCERSVSQDPSSCGGCGNDCRAQGAGLVCGPVPNQCGCVDNAGCRTGGSIGSCETDSGLCKCGPNRCQPGEACSAASGPDVCSCNGGAACTATETCCQTPAGCRDLHSDPSSCGACGHVCPNGFFCVASACACTTDAQCNAGAPGTCAAGQCVCGGVTCAPGRRCLADGHCG
jgi:hypothetical protein